MTLKILLKVLLLEHFQHGGIDLNFNLDSQDLNLDLNLNLDSYFLPLNATQSAVMRQYISSIHLSVRLSVRTSVYLSVSA